MTGIVACGSLNFRVGPSTSTRILRTVHKGDQLTIVGEEGSWYNVTFDGRTGWVAKKYVTVLPEPAVRTGIVNCGALNFRSGPGTGYKVLRTVHRNDKLTIHGEEGNWYRVCFEGKDGWVAKKYIDVTSYAGTSDVKPVEYKQSDPRWGKYPYTSCGNPKQTIASSGCGPVCAAMVVATLIDRRITPPDMAKLAVDNGFRTKNNGTAYAFFPFVAKKYGLKCTQYSGKYGFDPTIKALRKGALVVCCMGPGFFTSGGHYILAWMDDGVNIVVNNPGKGHERDKAPYDIFRTQAKAYWIITM